MDPYSSGEDLVIKTRKPYTITKQRERWTEEEHNRFLEALKLHGRAWQRIEEHIGTKTAVQIRSHAQKFFTKLEKEAVVKGVSIGHALDIEIPPPRPKRKPNNPYPRKTNVGPPTSQVGVKDGKSSSLPSSCQNKVTINLEKEHEKPCDDGKLGNSDDYWEKDNSSEAFAHLKTASCTSPSSANIISWSVNDAPRKSCTLRQYVPFPKEPSNQDETAASIVTIEANGLQADKSGNKKLLQDNAPLNISNVVNSYVSHEKSVNCTRTDVPTLPENVDTMPAADAHASQNYPRHVPVHILDGSLGMSVQTTSPDMSHTESLFNQMSGVHGNQNLFMNPAASATSEHYSNASRPSVCQSFPSYQPIFTPIQNPEDYQSFLHISSTFSSLIVSALSQNPAAYAAATFATTLWPAEPSAASAGAFQSRQISSTPSMAAIAAATVAAATAWWAAHGLLPLCAPFHPGFTCSPESASAVPGNGSHGKAVNNERKENSPDPALEGQQLEPECSEALQEQHSDSEASEDAKPNVDETSQVVATAELHDANKSKSKKQVDRSSCGSNTPSSSEVEGDASEKHTKGTEENHTKDKEELEELDTNHPAGDPFNRRCRSANVLYDSWKEVSEEGRLAFQALFSREVLPQSFSPPHKDKKTSIKECGESKEDDRVQIDLNRRTWTSSQKQGVEDNASLLVENKEEELPNMGLAHAKLKAQCTGFKPYKRCSMEAKESRMSANSHVEEKGAKRLRLEGEAST